MQASIEIFSGIAVGILLGYTVDHWLETTPIFMLSFAILGFLGGLLNCYRRIFKDRHNGK